MRTPRALSLWLLLCVAAASAGPLPAPPRNGRNSVQMIVGGRSSIPLCIVPPRQYVDGTAIPPGTPCTIVIYRSNQQGKPGTYVTEVGRADGRVTRPDDLQPWTNVTANAPPGAAGEAIYLASSAIVGGEESDLNNQWLTIVWSPGEFSVKEYPAAGSNPGPPPNRRNRRPQTDDYPDWLTGEGGGDTWELKAPEIEAWSDRESGDLTLPITFRVAPDGKVSGRAEPDPIVAEIRRAESSAQVSFVKNSVTGTYTNGVLHAHLSVQLTMAAQINGKPQRATMNAEIDLPGRRNDAGEIVGTGRIRATATMGGERESVDRSWEFTATRRGGGRGETLGLREPKFESEFGRPSQSFTPPAAAKSPQLSAMLLDHLRGTQALSIGDSYLFTQTDTPDVWVLAGGQRRDLPPARKVSEHEFAVGGVFAGPPSVLTFEKAGDGVRVKAVGNGIGEVWIATIWVWQDPQTQQQVAGRYLTTWVVLVGNAAIEAYKGGQQTLPPPPTASIFAGTIRGRAVMAGTGAPVAGAEVFLIHRPTQKSYHLDAWVTRDDGTFELTITRELPGGGLPQATYRVLVIKRSGQAGEVGVADDLWPVRYNRLDITRAKAAAGPMDAGTIEMQRRGEG